MAYDEKELEHRQIAVLPSEMRGRSLLSTRLSDSVLISFHFEGFTLHETPHGPRIGIHLLGTFYENLDRNATNFLNVYLDLLDSAGLSENVTEVYSIPIVDALQIDHADETVREIVFNIGNGAFTRVKNDEAVVRVQMFTNIDRSLPLRFAFDPSPINESVSVICAAAILLLLYVLIIFDIVHRTFAALLASTLALAVLAIMHQKVSMEEIISWIDVETLLLLFGMMVMVEILSETGVFDFLAVFAYKVHHKTLTSVSER